ncbi:MAG: DUF4124 domain-containing protein [Nitrospirae bacterium]|nr:MAG: DUF4124 domain-containing protein [Nitrospirota bacterium]
MDRPTYRQTLRLALQPLLVAGTLAALQAFATAFPLEAWGEIYRYVDRQGTAHFTNVPTDPRFKKIVPGSPALRLRMHKRDLEGTIARHSQRHRLDPALLRAVIKAESDFDPTAVSRAGAIGLMQLMPLTAVRLNVRDSYNPEENIGGGARYLRYLLDRFQGDLTLALAAYNAGEHVVDRYQAVPPIDETRLYVAKVLRFYRIYLRTYLLDEHPGSYGQGRPSADRLTPLSRPIRPQPVVSWPASSR